MDVPLTFCPRGWMFVMKKSSSHGSYQKCFPPLTAIEVGFWETRMQGKVAANKDFLMKSSIIESNFNVSKQRYVQTVLGNYYPLAREVCEAGSTLPYGEKSKKCSYKFRLQLQTLQCRTSDDNTFISLSFLTQGYFSKHYTWDVKGWWRGPPECLRRWATVSVQNMVRKLPNFDFHLLLFANLWWWCSHEVKSL